MANWNLKLRIENLENGNYNFEKWYLKLLKLKFKTEYWEFKIWKMGKKTLKIKN